MSRGWAKLAREGRREWEREEEERGCGWFCEPEQSRTFLFSPCLCLVKSQDKLKFAKDFYRVSHSWLLNLISLSLSLSLSFSLFSSGQKSLRIRGQPTKEFTSCFPDWLITLGLKFNFEFCNFWRAIWALFCSFSLSLNSLDLVCGFHVFFLLSFFLSP